MKIEDIDINIKIADQRTTGKLGHLAIVEYLVPFVYEKNDKEYRIDLRVGYFRLINSKFGEKSLTVIPPVYPKEPRPLQITRFICEDINPNEKNPFWKDLLEKTISDYEKEFAKIHNIKIAGNQFEKIKDSDMNEIMRDTIKE